MGPRLFNSLPKAVKECSSPDSFKRTLDEYIMSLPDTPPTPSYVTANNNSILDWAVTSSRTLPEELSWDLVSNLPKLPKLPKQRKISSTEKDLLRRQRSPSQTKISFTDKDLLRRQRSPGPISRPHLPAPSPGPISRPQLPPPVPPNKSCSDFDDHFKKMITKFIIHIIISVTIDLYEWSVSVSIYGGL